MADNYSVQTINIIAQALANTFTYIMQTANTAWNSANDDVEANTGPTFNDLISDWSQFGIEAAANASADSIPAFGIFHGTGAPEFTAGQGSIYSRADGANTSTRMYVNTTGANVWTAVMTET